MINKRDREKSLTEKLGINKDSKIALISPTLSLKTPQPFLGHLGVAASPQGLGETPKDKLDVILVWVETGENLRDLLSNLKTYLKPNGAVWLIIRKESPDPKATKKKVGENDITKSAEEAGLVKNKVIALPEAEYAFRLVIPLAAQTTA